MSLRAADSLMRYADKALVCCAGRFSLRLALPRGLRREGKGIRSFGIARNPPPPESPPQIRPCASRSRHAVFSRSIDRPQVKVFTVLGISLSLAA